MIKTTFNRAVIDTLADAISAVERGRWEGIECPCCGQYAKVYRRKLNSGMAEWLLWLVKQSRVASWVDIRDSSVRGGDYGKLTHWGLIQHMANVDPAKRGSGFWRPTDKGIAFAERRVSVPSHVFLYNNQVIGFSDSPCSIVDALGKKFDYTMLMQNKTELDPKKEGST